MEKFLELKEIDSFNAKSENRLTFALEYYISYLYGESIKINTVVNKGEQPINSDKRKSCKKLNKRILVTYNNGNIEISENNTETFVKVIDECGPAKVQALKIFHKGFELIMNKPINNSNNKQYFLEPRWYVFTDINTEQMVYDLQYISKKLDLNFSVDLLSYHQSKLDKKLNDDSTGNTLTKITSDDTTEGKSEDRVDGLRDQILYYLKIHPNIKASVIASNLKVKRKEVNSILYKLKDSGICCRDENYLWRLQS